MKVKTLTLVVLLVAGIGLLKTASQHRACAFAGSGNEAGPSDDDPDVVPLEEAPTPGGSFPVDANPLVAGARAYGAEHPDVFADLFLAGGRLWLGFTADAASHLVAVRARVDRPDLLRAFIADYTERDLRALQERISGDLSNLARERILVESVALDVVHNRVEIGLASSGADARRILTRRYGPAMIVIRGGVEAHPTTARKC